MAHTPRLHPYLSMPKPAPAQQPDIRPPQAAATSIASLTPDARNANKGSERGSGMLEQSLRQYGAGRSILVDKHGVVMAGNKTLEAAASIGLDQIQLVQSDGTKLVVVQRTDLDLKTDAKAKELAVADNRVAEVSLEWDADVLQKLIEDGADLSGLFTQDELSGVLQIVPDFAPVDEDEQGRLDQKKPVTCPACGHEFTT